jgi:HPr kinase/phosphorylase
LENDLQKFSQEFFKELKVDSTLTVKELYEHNKSKMSLHIINNKAGFKRKITEGELHRPGLALGGFIQVFTYWRIQIMGNSEITFLNTMSSKARAAAISTLLSFELPCIIITNDNKAPDELVEIANKSKVTIFSTPLNTTRAVHYLTEYLDRAFAPQTIVHASMVDVHGVGMLIVGSSSIGKSELALDLVERGHQLVADDVVHIIRLGTNLVQGGPSELLEHHMEIRGLGIIDIRRMFGIRAIRDNKIIQIVVRIEAFDANAEYERIGVDERTIEILGVSVPFVDLPIMPGKNLTVIVEAIALNLKLKLLGEHAAKEFNDNLIKRMSNSRPNKSNES